VSPAVRPGDSGPRAPARRARGCHRPSDRGVDRATASRGVSVEQCAALSPPRSRYRVPRVGHNDTGDGHPRSGHRSPLTMAGTHTSSG
jgi:hypothetical protein